MLTRIALLGLVAAAATLGPSRAHAGLKSYSGTLEVRLAGVTMTSSPVTGTVAVAADGSFSLPAMVFSIASSVFSGPLPGVTFFSLTAAPAAGSFAPTPAGGFGGSMRLQGGAYFGLTNEALSVPLAVVGGATTASAFFSGLSTITGTVVGGPWRTEEAKIVGVQVTTASGATNPMGTLALQGYDARTAGGEGNIQLVTPILFNMSGGAIAGNYGSFGVLTLQFAPEPAAAWLGLAGLAAAVPLALRRRRRSG